MSLKINKLGKNGDASQEYLLLEATEDLNLQDYAVVDRTFDETGNVSNVFRHTYRFPAKPVKKGEFVSLRTGKGKDELTALNNGKPLHRFYWGSDAAVWNDAAAESVEVWKVATVSKTTTGNPAPTKKQEFTFRPKGLNYGGKK